MTTVNIKINLCSFDELSEKAKTKAIDEHRQFLLSVMRPSDFAEYDYYLMNDEPIIENIKANEYLFFENGELAHTVHYCGKHPLCGKTFFIFQGVEYDITK